MAITNYTKEIYGRESSLSNKKVVSSGYVNTPNVISSSAINTVVATTSALISSGDTTEININSIGTSIFDAGDKITLIDSTSKRALFLEVNATQGASDTTLTISEYTFDWEIGKGSFITHTETDLITQYQRKSRGTVGGMAVTASTLGPITYTDGVYNIIGVDAPPQQLEFALQSTR